ncbi:MAG: glycerophosphodiester phosphodiesterase, partial [Bacteroidales bacterium]|nr:glycerophosphodiester phosphodiesterase [Bacteroidales bacterium]
MKNFIYLLIVLTVVAACDKKPEIDVQAHRGGAGLYPENTKSAMKNALDLDVNTLEFDLQLSQDGQVVVSHDNYFHPRYATRPDGTLIQEEDPKEYLYLMPYDSIVKYDVGLRPVDRWPGQQKVAEVKPLASDLIDFTESYAKKPVNYNIEIKSWPGAGEGILWPDYKTFCNACVPLLLSKNLGDRLIVQCFDTRALNYMHEKW